MSQALLFIPIHIVGVVIALGCGLRDRPLLASAMGFPLGLAATVSTLLLLLIATLPLGFVSVGIALGLPLSLGVWRLRGHALDGSAIVKIAIFTALFGSVSALLAKLLPAAMTFDSHTFIIIGKTIVNDGLSNGVINQLRSWGAFVVLAQSLEELLPNEYLYAITPTLAASFTATFAILLWHALGPHADARARWRAVGFVALVLVALSTIFMYGYNFIYIHTNFGSAAYLFLFVALFRMAELEPKPALLPLATIALIAFCIHRVETPAIAGLFLVLTVPHSSLPRRALGAMVIAVTIFVTIWYGTITVQMGGDGENFLTPMRVAVIVGGLFLVCANWALAKKSWVVTLNKYLPQLIAGLLALALLGAFITKPAHMATSTEHLIRNLTGPFWGWAWAAIVVIAGLSVAMPRVPIRRAFVYGIPIYIGLIVLLAYPRIPYRLTFGDSANRMMIHLVPLLFFYFGLAFWPALQARAKPTAD